MEKYHVILLLMKGKLSVPLKAVFLLVVFLLNTVVGFACAVTMQNGIPQQEQHATESHKHTDHYHANHYHANHDHSKSAEAHHDLTDHHGTKKDNDECCKDEVTKLLKEDKVSPSKIKFSIQPDTFFTLLPTYCQLDALAFSVYQPTTKYFVRSYHPPIRDIRISIQSFQI
ncbi:hypothetical protein FBD94_04130 [Pedobacter hiemivivus]|uniref:Uncharacterized protein n=1 Tax=Pedobacter hiemivivus TaxID=2530454 RepID=A0A4U1GH55_9SPHI|nr:hypothetical protein [Pedobacter hiemivivus]TKC63555.1 hypothetical protein FBD94_04130 [Pedobacter hiemivivus]